MINTIVEAIQEKKGKDILSISLQHIPGADCSHFIICNADSSTQVSAIADQVADHTFKTLHLRPYSTEGLNNAEWVLLNYGHTIVHVFRTEIRARFALEELWADGIFQHFSDTN